MDNNFNSSDSLNNPNSMTNISDFQDSNHLNSDVCSLNSVDVMTNSTNVLDSPGNISGNLVSKYMSEQQDFSSPLNQQGVFEGAENSYYQQQILPDSFELASNHYMTMDVKPHVSQMLYDDQIEYTQTENSLNNGLSDQIDPFQSHQNFDPNDPHGIVIGNPSEEMQYWHQQISSDACGIATQQSAIEHINHQSYSQEKLLNDAQDNHWYSQNIGTPVEDFGKLITEETHVPVETHYDANINEIIDKLHHGEEVFVGVNSDIEWLPDHNSLLGQVAPDLFDSHQYQGAEANHIVQVIGVEIDPINPHNSYVIVNDSSSADGRGMEIPLDQFQEAMNASHGYIASTEIHHNNLSENSDHTMNFRGCHSYGFDDSRQNFYIDGNLRGHCEGRKFYTDSHNHIGNYKGCIGRDMSIYDSQNVKIAYIDSCGNVRKNDGTIVLNGENHSGFANAAYYLLNLVG